jgi:hypothetical protein
MASSSRRAVTAALVFGAATIWSVARAADVAVTPRSIVNQSGATVESGGARWLGTGANAAVSRLGLIFALPELPRTALRSATLMLTAAWTQWISVDVRIAAELSPNPADFGPGALPSDRSLTARFARYAENSRWGVNGTYEIDVTEPVRAVLSRFAHPSAIALIAAGQGTPWGRKYFASAGAAPALKLTFDDPPAPPPAPAGALQNAAPSAASPGASETATM